MNDFVWVRRQWNSYNKAKYKLTDISGIRWDTISGGVNAPAPQPFIHGYVSCDGMSEGALDHSGIHGACPHPNIKVCIVKIDNDPMVFAKILDIAGPKPQVAWRIGDRKAKPGIKYKYMASKNSDVFHLTTCQWAARISEGNQVYFQTYQEALSSGKRPCGVCKPKEE